MKRTKVYISGPITGVKDYISNFADAEAELAGLGYEPVNPVTIGMELAEKLGREPTQEEYMEADLAALEACDEIMLLDGWENSKGARIEWEQAKKLGIPPVYLEVY
jgi:hypothetical protein